MNKRILALDLGITSIGYSILEEFENDKHSLVDYGVSMFDKATDKDGKSKKLLHSASASASNLVNLRKERKKNLAKLFEEFGFGDKEYFLYQEKQNIYKNKWELRAKKAFEEKLKIEQLFSIFYMIAKHRGYKSLDASDLLEELCVELNIPFEEEKSKNDDEKGKIKQALRTIENLRIEYPNKTVAAIIYEEEFKNPNPSFRNHDNYKYMIRREYINDEIKKIIASQEKFGLFDKNFNRDEFTSKLVKTIDDQKESSNDMGLFAPCEFYKEHKVSHQYSLIADIYKMYQAVSNITFNTKPTIKITKEQIKFIADDFFDKIKKGKNITDIKYKDIRKFLKLNDNIKIFGKDDYSLKNDKKLENTIIKFHFVNNLSKIDNSFILKAFEKDNPYQELKEIFDTLGFEKSPKSIYEKLKNKVDDKTIIELIKHKTGSSLRTSSYAMVKFIPYFEEGLTLDEIKQELNLNRSEDYGGFKKGIKYLNVSQFENDDNLPINNHPVKYVVSAVLRLVKHLHATYGAFDEIRVESTRELSLSDDAKKEIEKANRALEKQIEDIVANKEYQIIAEHYGKNLRKYARKILMWQEQEFLDIYGKPVNGDIYTGDAIGIEEIFSGTYDIDHIIPKSLGGLTVKHNLVLTHKDNNLRKSNRLPLGFIQDKQQFENRVLYLFSKGKINWKKKINLLATNLDETFKDTFESKSLRATSYIEALTAQILKRYYPFANETKQKDGSSVRHIQGRATSNIRKVLQVKIKTRDTNIHHAIDAILIGLTNKSWLQKLSNTFRENLGKIDDEARANIKKSIPLIEGIEPKELVEMIEDRYNEFGEESVFYKDIWDKTKAVNFWVSKKPDSSRLHEAGIYGIDKINGKIENKQYTGYTTLRVDIIKRLKDSQKKPDLPKIGDNGDDFIKQYNESIIEKLYLYQYNQNDKIVNIVQNKGKEIANCLNKYIDIDKKDKEAFQKAQSELSSTIDNPLVDYNGNIIRKVKMIYSNKTNEDMIRGGTTVSERTTLGISVSSGDKDKLKFKRIDFKNKLAKNLSEVLDKNSLNIYRNDLVCLIFKNQDKNIIGYLESYDENDGRARLFSAKYPKLVEFQPKYFIQGGSRRRIGIKSAMGIIKLNLDILGNIKSYQTIGDVQSELFEFIKEVCSAGMEKHKNL